MRQSTVFLYWFCVLYISISLLIPILFSFFFFNDTATPEIYPLPLHGRSSDLFWRPTLPPPARGHPSRRSRRSRAEPSRWHSRQQTAHTEREWRADRLTSITRSPSRRG